MTEARPRERRGSATRSSFGFLIARVLSIPLILATSILIARILGPFDRGIYSFLLVVGTFSLRIGSVGFQSATTYFIASERYSVHEAGVSFLLAGLVQGVIAGGLVLALWSLGWLGKTGASVGPVLINIIVFTMPIRGLNEIGLRILLGSSWFSLYNYIQLGKPFVMFFLMGALVALARFGVLGAVAASAISESVLCIFLMASISGRFGLRMRTSMAPIIAGYSYGVRNWLGYISGQANARLDQLILGLMMPSSEIGIYGISVRLVSVLGHITDAVGAPLMNRIAQAKGDPDRVLIACRVHRVLFVIIVICALLLAVIGWWLIPLLYGKEYLDARGPMLILLPGVAFSTTRKVLSKFFSGSGLPGRSSLATASGVLVNVPGALLLVPLAGMMGCACSTSIAASVAALVSVWLFVRCISPQRSELFRYRVQDIQWTVERLRGALRSSIGRKTGEVGAVE